MPPVLVHEPGSPEVENVQPGLEQDALLMVKDRP